MARIRSVHPGFWSDETMVCLRVETRLFLIGLWNECDDQGAFEWKPLGLKMRIFPADNFDVAVMLSELEAADVVKSYEMGGRKYGVVRNFGKFQRPKKPNSIHLMPAELRTYAGLSPSSSEPVPHQFPTSPEKSSQMEDGGGIGGEEERAKPRANVIRHPANGAGPPKWPDSRIVESNGRPSCNGTYVDTVSEKLAEAAGLPLVPLADRTMLGWLADGYEVEEILPVVRRVIERSGQIPKSLAYFDKAVREQPPTWYPLDRQPIRQAARIQAT